MYADTRIHSLRLRGAEDQRRAVLAHLEQADWDLARGEEVLMLRRLEVAGSLATLGGLLGERAREAAARAVDGWVDWSDQAEAVRFASRADLLACLARDLLRGRRRWFWLDWQGLFGQPAGAAVAAALGAEVRHWPEVVRRLRARGEGETQWRNLAPAHAEELLDALTRATGWSVWQAEAEPDPAQADRAALADTPGWLRQVARTQDTRDDAAVLHLAVVTWLWQRAPQRLARPEAAREVAGLVRAMRARGIPGRRGQENLPDGPAEESALPTIATLARESVARPDDTGQISAHPAISAGNIRAAIGTDATHGHATVDTTLPAARTADAGPAKPEASAGGFDAASAMPATVPSTSSRIRTPPAEANSEPESVAPTSFQPAPRRPAPPDSGEFLAPQPEPAPDSTRCITAQGGWFLLLNALALPACRELLSADTAPGAGWHWLHRLGSALGGAADPPLARFFASAMELDPESPLDALPPLAHEADIVRLARARFGEAVCDATLFPVPALVEAGLSHVDVYYRMADIRLAVRRVALDADPGWLPWLGRVVRFHYGEVAELAGLRPEGGPP